MLNRLSNVKVYGGCEGNGNRFASISECEGVCGAHVVVPYRLPNPICSLPPTLLTAKACFGYFPR